MILVMTMQCSLCKIQKKNDVAIPSIKFIFSLFVCGLLQDPRADVAVVFVGTTRNLSFTLFRPFTCEYNQYGGFSINSK